MSFRYNLPHSVTLGPQRHSFLRYPTVPIQPLGSTALPPEPTTADTLLKWAFWMGAGFAAVQVFDKLTRKPAWEMNPRRIPPKEALRMRAELVALYKKGASAGAAARSVGITVTTAIKWLKEEGVYDPKPVRHLNEQQKAILLEEYEPATNLSKLAREIGVSRHSAKKFLERKGLYIPAPMGGVRGPTGLPSEEKCRALLASYKPGMNVIPLAKRVGVSHRAAHELLRAAGVYRAYLEDTTIAERKKALFRLYKPASNLTEIVREIGVPYYTAVRWLEEEEADFFAPAPMGGVRGPRDMGKKHEVSCRYASGERPGELAKSLGVSTATINRWMKEEALYKPAPKGASRKERLYQEALLLYVPGESVTPLAEELGVHRDTVIRWMTEAGKYKPAPRLKPRRKKTGRSPEMERLYKELLSLYEKREPVLPLAKRLGISQDTAIRWLKEAGVYKPARSGPPRDEQIYQEVLRRYIPGKPVLPLAKDLGLNRQTVVNWLKEAGKYKPAPRDRKKKQNPEPYAFGGW